MAPKPVISIKCPCCKAILEVNTEKQRVVSHRSGRHLTEDAKEGEDKMDVALRNHEERKAKVEDDFTAAQKGLANQSSRLDRLFEQAKEKAKDADPEEDPDNPFAGGKKVWD